MAANGELRGKVIVITGASSGFGKGASLEYAKRGASVVLASRQAAVLNSVAHECESIGGRGLAVETDVSDLGAVRRLSEQAIAAFGHFDVWINNAGVGVIGRFDEAPIEDHRQVIETNLLGATYGSYYALKHFHERGEGILVNIASAIGKIPAPFYASYVAAKFGIVGLTDAIRQELKLNKITSIRACTVMPMAHDTEFFEHAGNYTGHEAKPIPPTYDQKEVVDKLVALATHPEDEVIVGWQGKIYNFLHRLMPGAIEGMMARQTEQSQLKDAPEAERTSGSIHHPIDKSGPRSSPPPKAPIAT